MGGCAPPGHAVSGGLFPQAVPAHLIPAAAGGLSPTAHHQACAPTARATFVTGCGQSAAERGGVHTEPAEMREGVTVTLSDNDSIPASPGAQRPAPPGRVLKTKPHVCVPRRSLQRRPGDTHAKPRAWRVTAPAPPSGVQLPAEAVALNEHSFPESLNRSDDTTQSVCHLIKCNVCLVLPTSQRLEQTHVTAV